MLSLRLGRSRTCPMLALTTNAEPRNLLIDLAFFGLSTITSERPLGPSPPDAGRPTFAFDFAGAFAFGFAFEAVEEAARFGGFASGDASGLDGALADLRATGSPYPLARRPLRVSRWGESDPAGRPLGAEVCICFEDDTCY